MLCQRILGRGKPRCSNLSSYPRANLETQGVKNLPSSIFLPYVLNVPSPKVTPPWDVTSVARTHGYQSWLLWIDTLISREVMDECRAAKAASPASRADCTVGYDAKVCVQEWPFSFHLMQTESTRIPLRCSGNANWQTELIQANYRKSRSKWVTALEISAEDGGPFTTLKTVPSFGKNQSHSPSFN